MSKASWDNPVRGAKWVRTWRLGEWLSDPVSPLFETLLVPILATAREKGGIGHLDWKLPRGMQMKGPWFCIVNGYFYARADSNPLSLAKFLLLDVPRIEKAIARWRRVNLPPYLERLKGSRAFCLEDATPDQLLEHIEELCRDAGAWWHLVSLDGGILTLAPCLSKKKACGSGKRSCRLSVVRISNRARNPKRRMQDGIPV